MRSFEKRKQGFPNQGLAACATWMLFWEKMDFFVLVVDWKMNGLEISPPANDTSSYYISYCQSCSQDIVIAARIPISVEGPAW